MNMNSLRISDYVYYNDACTDSREKGFILSINKSVRGEIDLEVQNVSSDLKVVMVDSDEFFSKVEVKDFEISKNTYDLFVDLALSTKDMEWLEKLTKAENTRGKVIE